MLDSKIPFNQPDFGHLEAEMVGRAMASVTSGNGPFCKDAEELLAGMHPGSSALLTPSCSSALELAARLVGFQPGDEVIVPSFTFVTTVSSFVTNGATPVFCDIDSETLGLDVRKAESLITERTRAICLVHYAGVPADPLGFADLAERYNLVLIEDNAHGLGGLSGGKTLGTFGAMSTLSFHETKNISCGEGGALIINNPELLGRAEVLREKGTDRSKFLRGQIDKYTWVDDGSSWVLSDVLASILVAQLHRFQELQTARRRVWMRYFEELSAWAQESGVSIQGRDVSHTSHLFYLIFPGAEARDRFIDYMDSKGVMAVFHYQPLHLSRSGRNWLKEGSSFPVSEQVSDGLVRLPLFSGLSDSDVTRVVEAVKSYSPAQLRPSDY